MARFTVHVPAVDDGGGGAQILDATVRARADEDGVDGDRRASRVPAVEAHVGEGPLRGLPIVRAREGSGIGHRPVDADHLRRVRAPRHVRDRASRRR